MARAPSSSFVLETAPPSVITVHRRTPSQKKLDTIAEESCPSLPGPRGKLEAEVLEAEVANSFSSMSLEWQNGSEGQSHSSYQRHGSSYVICAQ